MDTFRQKITKLGVFAVKKTEALSALSCRLVQITGKHENPIHPKHLVKIRPPWYLSKLKKSDIVLDIGCNNGQHTTRAAQVVKHVYGFDKDPQMLQFALQEITRLGMSNITLRQGDAQKKFPYQNSYFDVIIFLDVFEHLPERTKVLKEIRRVLKPKGILLLSIPNCETSWKKLQRKLGMFYYSDPDHKIEFSKAQIKLLLNRSDFIVKTIEPVTFDTPWVGIIDLIGGISLNFYKTLSKWRRVQALRFPQESIGFEIVCQKRI